MSSFRQRVAALFEKKAEEPTMQDDLKKLGLTTLADQKFAERQGLLSELLDSLTKRIEEETPQKQVEALEELLNDVHIGIHTLAAPYYQTLDNINYHRLMRGWSAWHALADLWISTVKARIISVEKQQKKESESEIEEIDNAFPMIIAIKTVVAQLTSVLYLHVFQDAHLILLQSYSAEDVREKWAVVVNQPYQFGPRVPTKESPEGYEMISQRFIEQEQKIRELEEKLRNE